MTMPGVDAILPTLPPFLIAPVSILLILIFMWPTLREIWHEVIPSYRLYSRERMRLELLKLAYEIEAIKKTNGLTNDGPSVLETLHKVTSHAVTAEAQTESQRQGPAQMPKLQAFGCGCLGGFAVVIFQLVTIDLSNILSNPSAFVFVAYLIRVVLLVLMGGLTAIFRNPKTPVEAFMFGLIAPLLVALVISGTAQHDLQPTAQLPMPRS